MSKPTIDTAIASWKAATTEAGRDLAAEAIEQHIAHETPEDADHEAATTELLGRLKAEFGPVPVEDVRRGYQISTPAYETTYYVGTEEEALDAFARDAGYCDFAEVADTLSKSIDDAKADLIISRV